MTKILNHYNIFNKYLFILSLLLIILKSYSFSAGTTAAEFLKIGVSPRASGMAGAFTAVSNETSGILYNPAGLGFIVSPEFQSIYSLWLGDVYSGFLGYSMPVYSGTCGIGLQYLSSSSIPKIEEGKSNGNFNFYDMAANLAYALRVNETLSIGFNVKDIQNKIDNNIASTFSGDIGIISHTFTEGISCGFAAQNIFGRLEEDKLPLTYRGGLSFKGFSSSNYSEYNFSIEAVKPESSSLYYLAGFEHWGAGTLGLRAGYKYAADQKQRDAFDPISAWSIGISIRTRSLSFDYSYQPFSLLGIGHKFGVSWRSSGWKSKKYTIPAVIEADPAIFSPNGDEAKDTVFFIPQNLAIKDINNWSLEIFNKNYKIVKKIQGKDFLPKILSWDGKNNSNTFVKEGKYFYHLTVDSVGKEKAESKNGEIFVDLTPPTVSLKLSSDTFNINTKKVNNFTAFYLSAADNNIINSWMLSITNSKNKTIKIFKSTETVPSQIIWNGKDDYYNKIPAKGDYYAQFSVWDAAGNKAKAIKKFKILIISDLNKNDLPPSQNINITENSSNITIVIPCKNLFINNESKIKNEFIEELDNAVNLLNIYSDNKVLIEGHYDGFKNKAKDIEISASQAWAVYSYFVMHGINPSRLKIKGAGADKSAESLQNGQSKRIEIIILKIKNNL